MIFCHLFVFDLAMISIRLKLLAGKNSEN